LRDTKKLRGIIGMRGRVKGKIKVVVSLEDVRKVGGDDIIVIKDNNPLFFTAFLRAKGIISERGGKLCHLAIVAREMKKPCLLGVSQATKFLKNGMIVILDCEKGEVIIKNE